MDAVWDCVLLALILGPAEPANVPDVPRSHPAYQALVRQNIALDVWDSHDGYGNFSGEVKWSRQMFRSMADYPPSSDRSRWLGFKPRHEIEFYAVCLDRAYAQNNMEAVAIIGGWLETWRCLGRVVDVGPIPYRRRALADLRDAIGPAAYYAGRMP